MDKRHVSAGLLVAALLAAPGFATAQQPGFRWEKALAAGKTLEISDINGSIEARPADGGAALVTARKTARIVVEERADRIVLCVVYESGDSCRGGRHDHDHSDDRHDDIRVDFTVRVPTGVRLEASTVNGEVTARDLRGDVDVSSVNGDVEATGTGVVAASTVNGSITAALGRGSWSGTLGYHTVNGSITVVLPADAGAEVQATTVNGQLSTDFPLTISAGKPFGPKTVEGTIGSGGGRLELETVNGSIHLQRG